MKKDIVRIDADKLKAEIERLKAENESIKCASNGAYCTGYDDAFYDLLSFLKKQKEQKPASTEEMPYITDEHFYEREPADSFKYKLAEYMTKNCTKKESPYGYSYSINSESILQMAKDELLKRGVVQKPAEWSEEDEEMLEYVISDVNEAKQLYTPRDAKKMADKEIAWLKSLRPQKKED